MRILRDYILGKLLATYAVTAFAIASLLWLFELLDGLESGVSGPVDLILLGLSALMMLPESLIDLLPVITVLATASAMGAFQVRNELTVMRSSGISLWRLTGLALVPGLIVAGLALASLQWVIPNLQQSPESLVGASLGESGLWDPAHGLWVRGGNEFLNVQDLYLGRIPTGINLYRFSPEGGLIDHTEAGQAVVEPDGNWLLEDVTVRDYQAESARDVRYLTEQRWSSFLTGRQLELFLSPPASLALTDLWLYVAALNERNQEVAEFEMILWRRLALPLSCIGMVLAAMATAAVPLKSRVVSVRLVAALGLGLGFQLVSEMFSYLGLVLAWPVIAVALGPSVLLTVFSWWLLKKAR